MSMRSVPCLASFLLVLQIAFCQSPLKRPPGAASIIASGSTLEKVFGGGEFTEGPAVARDGSVYFSDLTFESQHLRGRIWRYDPKSGKTVLFRSPSGMSNGIEFDSKGRMVVAEGDDRGARRVTRTLLPSGDVQVLAADYRGKPFNSPNDLAIDSNGRIYFTDPRYWSPESITQPVMGVYRVDPDGKVALLVDSISMPNGIAISPDEKTLYIGCFDKGSDAEPHGAPIRKQLPPRMAIFAFDLMKDGSLRAQRMFVDLGPKSGPDGLTVDHEGNVYAAIRDEASPAIHVYDPNGRLLVTIPTPEVPSNLAFAPQPDGNLLYITAGGSLHRVRIRRHGSQSPSER